MAATANGPGWSNVRRVLEWALAVPPSERMAIVESACAGDEELARRVLRLLSFHDEGEAAAAPTGSGATALLENVSRAVPSGRVGPYELCRRLGAGGMGEVFLAVRADGAFHRRVALKLVRPASSSAADLARLERERRVQAELDHPWIARLLDGGTAEDGTPFLVHEYVEGPPVPRHADEQNLSVAERLALFAEVCDAVEYAHQRHVVHSDLKPANVLVTAEGQPKLIDFGIARRVEPDRGEARGKNGVEAGGEDEPFFTPAWAAPEVLRGEAASPASDQYSLGVMLYTLVTGQLPFELEGRSLAEIERIVGERTPPPPSRLARESGRAVRADLDRIVAMATHVDPRHRYASVGDLASDVRRYLAGEPVRARSGGAMYRFGRFASRHRALVGLAAGVVASLAVALVASLAYGRETLAAERNESRERARAERRLADQQKLARTVMFNLVRSIDGLPGAARANTLALQTGVRLQDRLVEQEPSDPRLLTNLCQGYVQLAKAEAKFAGSTGFTGFTGDESAASGVSAAQRAFDQALQLAERLLEEHPRLPAAAAAAGRAFSAYGGFLRERGDRVECLRYLERASVLLERVLPEPGEPGRRPALTERFLVLKIVAQTDLEAGRFESGLRHVEEGNRALDQICEEFPEARIFTEGDRVVLASQASHCELRLGNTARAIELAQQGIDAADPLGGRHAGGNVGVTQVLVQPRTALSSALLAHGDYAGALAVAQEALELVEELATRAPENTDVQVRVAAARMRTGSMALMAGDRALGRGMLVRGLQATDELLESDPRRRWGRDTALSGYISLGRLEREEGNLVAAGECLGKARELAQELIEERPDGYYAWRCLRIVYLELGRAHLDAAEAAERESPERRSRAEVALVWFERARELERESAPHGFESSIATSPDALEWGLGRCGEILGVE